MSEYTQQAIRPIQELERWQSAILLSTHDRRLMMNDPLIYTLANHMVRFMDEYGTHTVATAFRAACAMLSNWKRNDLYDDVSWELRHDLP